jgi:hypothetical protein
MKITLTKDEVMKILLDSLPVNLDTQEVEAQISDWDFDHYLTVNIKKEA